jgi:opacity protein-like surface antigen
MVVEQSPFYLGIGIGDASVNDDDTSEEFSATTLMLQAGYQYNEYIALEGRYTFGLDMDYSPGNTNSLSSDYDGDFSSWGLYVKPMYPIGNFSLYALLGYGGVMLDNLAGGDAYESGFQWGLGAGYAMSENYTVFVDYVSLYDDTGFDYRARLDDIDSDTWTFGVSYRF